VLQSPDYFRSFGRGEQPRHSDSTSFGNALMSSSQLLRADIHSYFAKLTVSDRHENIVSTCLRLHATN